MYSTHRLVARRVPIPQLYRVVEMFSDHHAETFADQMTLNEACKLSSQLNDRVREGAIDGISDRTVFVVLPS